MKLTKFLIIFSAFLLSSALIIVNIFSLIEIKKIKKTKENEGIIDETIKIIDCLKETDQEILINYYREMFEKSFEENRKKIEFFENNLEKFKGLMTKIKEIKTDELNNLQLRFFEKIILYEKKIQEKEIKIEELIKSISDFNNKMERCKDEFSEITFLSFNKGFENIFVNKNQYNFGFSDEQKQELKTLNEEIDCLYNSLSISKQKNANFKFTFDNDKKKINSILKQEFFGQQELINKFLNFYSNIKSGKNVGKIKVFSLTGCPGSGKRHFVQTIAKALNRKIEEINFKEEMEKKFIYSYDREEDVYNRRINGICADLFLKLIKDTIFKKVPNPIFYFSNVDDALIVEQILIKLFEDRSCFNDVFFIFGFDVPNLNIFFDLKETGKIYLEEATMKIYSINEMQEILKKIVLEEVEKENGIFIENLNKAFKAKGFNITFNQSKKIQVNIDKVFLQKKIPEYVSKTGSFDFIICCDCNILNQVKFIAYKMINHIKNFFSVLKIKENAEKLLNKSRNYNEDQILMLFNVSFSEEYLNSINFDLIFKQFRFLDNSHREELCKICFERTILNDEIY